MQALAKIGTQGTTFILVLETIHTAATLKDLAISNYHVDKESENILIHKYISILPFIKLYWPETSPFFNPCVSSKTAHNRYEQLGGYLHMIEQRKIKAERFGLTDLLSALPRKFSKTVTVDETIKGFK